MQGPELTPSEPLDGRGFETYGEDPSSRACSRGRRARHPVDGVMAEAKHFGAYTQETARARLNQVVSARTLAEIYDAPFRAVVEQGHVAASCAPTGSSTRRHVREPVHLFDVALVHFADLSGRISARAQHRAAFEPDLTGEAGVVASLQRSVTSRQLSISDLNRAWRSCSSDVSFSRHRTARQKFDLHSGDDAGHVRWLFVPPRAASCS